MSVGEHDHLRNLRPNCTPRHWETLCRHRCSDVAGKTDWIGRVPGVDAVNEVSVGLVSPVVDAGCLLGLWVCRGLQLVSGKGHAGARMDVNLHVKPVIHC